MRGSSPSALQRRQRGDGLHQRLGGAAGFRDGDEARGLMRQPRQQRGEGLRIEIVHEMQARRRAQARRRRARRGRRAAPASARRGWSRRCRATTMSVAPSASRRRGVADRRQIVMRFRQPQQRQAAVGMARAQAVERGLGARRARRSSASSATPCWPMFFSSALSMDWIDRHGRCTFSRDLASPMPAASGRSQPVTCACCSRSAPSAGRPPSPACRRRRGAWPPAWRRRW